MGTEDNANNLVYSPVFCNPRVNTLLLQQWHEWAGALSTKAETAHTKFTVALLLSADMCPGQHHHQSGVLDYFL